MSIIIKILKINKTNVKIDIKLTSKWPDIVLITSWQESIIIKHIFVYLCVYVYAYTLRP